MRKQRLTGSGWPGCLIVVPLSCMLSCSVAVLGSPLHAQGKGKRSAKIKPDPYTGGDTELMKRAGYERFGPFTWLSTQRPAEGRPDAAQLLVDCRGRDPFG